MFDSVTGSRRPGRLRIIHASASGLYSARPVSRHPSAVRIITLMPGANRLCRSAPRELFTEFCLDRRSAFRAFAVAAIAEIDPGMATMRILVIVLRATLPCRLLLIVFAAALAALEKLTAQSNDAAFIWHHPAFFRLEYLIAAIVLRPAVRPTIKPGFIYARLAARRLTHSAQRIVTISPRSAQQRMHLTMNNSRGPAMLAALKPGDLVTVRDADGRRITGRVELLSNGHWGARPGPHLTVRITESNIISIQEG